MAYKNEPYPWEEKPRCDHDKMREGESALEGVAGSMPIERDYRVTRNRIKVGEDGYEPTPV